MYAIFFLPRPPPGQSRAHKCRGCMMHYIRDEYPLIYYIFFIYQTLLTMYLLVNPVGTREYPPGFRNPVPGGDRVRVFTGSGRVGPKLPGGYPCHSLDVILLSRRAGSLCLTRGLYAVCIAVDAPIVVLVYCSCCQSNNFSPITNDAMFLWCGVQHNASACRGYFRAARYGSMCLTTTDTCVV